MRIASAITARCAKSGGAETGIDFSVLGIEKNINSALTEAIKIKWPLKTWAILCEVLWDTKRIEMTERVAKHRLSNTRDYSVEELQAMLQSEDGLDFLAVLMADAQPKWWWWAKQVMTVASIKRRRAEDEQEILKLETSAPAETGARRRIKGALDANRNIKAAVDRAETALGFQRPDMAGRNADASSNGAGVSGRAVAPAKRAYAGRGR
ncbi:hypothetical protein SAMN03159423_4828 [Bradyrhizobium sp. NFR13]|uniref:hypothetical protein n=1 Tax=Bradyrhizobium sp. NFR13 TaxID=1566285 RepID=UPI0008E57B12|nr:hypothetical protein [Bradyrhizobium sp. NFR13]SFM00115.1 hypothetical protein SAMN03159423_4828 [Bradyrhizobium sp. NFR13]